MKPFTHALALGFSRRVPTEGSCKRLFCFLRDPDAMRYVGGGEIRNPVTRASQSRDGGRIPRAGWLKESGIVRCEDMAPKSTERTVDLDHGKAVLCSNIHQRAPMKIGRAHV